MILIVFGTRPEIIKMSPIIKHLEKKGQDYKLVHTNQHFSYKMDKVFFEELELPQPHYSLKVGQRLKRKKTIVSHGPQTGMLLEGVEKILLQEKPKITLVEGDTNSVLAGALASAKLGVKVGHVEAGLRSYDRKMPEEINRVITDHISDLLFCPTQKQVKILLGEGIEKEKIHLTGNTIVDALTQNIELAERKSKIMEKLNLNKQAYFLVTAHREENITKKEKLEKLIEGLGLIAKEYNLPVIYPIHIRTQKMIKLLGLKIPKSVLLIEPLGYLDFLSLMKNAKLILTDSGGVQEEACILKVPCVTLRENTERPETIEVGANMLAGTEPRKILESAKTMLSRRREWRNPFGDGKSGQRIAELALAQ